MTTNSTLSHWYSLSFRLPQESVQKVAAIEGELETLSFEELRTIANAARRAEYEERTLSKLALWIQSGRSLREYLAEKGESL